MNIPRRAMSTLTKEHPQISPLGTANTNIPSLAVQAASELDDILENRSTSSPSSKQLGEVLLAAVKGTKNGKHSVSIGSGTVAVFCHALEQLPDQDPINTMSDLVSLATKIAKELSDSKQQSEINRLKQFCIALAKASSSYRPTLDSYDPPIFRR
jgi:HPt (histidine-containing phosphotransfer) domain-containing protein